MLEREPKRKCSQVGDHRTKRWGVRTPLQSLGLAKFNPPYELAIQMGCLASTYCSRRVDVFWGPAGTSVSPWGGGSPSLLMAQEAWLRQQNPVLNSLALCQSIEIFTEQATLG